MCLLNTQSDLGPEPNRTSLEVQLNPAQSAIRFKLKYKTSLKAAETVATGIAIQVEIRTSNR